MNSLVNRQDLMVEEPLPLANRKSTIYGAIIPFQVLALIAGTVRLYVRFRVVRSPGLDDAFVFLAMLSTTVGMTSVCLATEAGLGQHLHDFTADSIREYLIYFYIANGTYSFSTTFIKLSLLCQYLRIFLSGYVRWICIGLIVFVSIWGLGTAFLVWFPCFPVHGYWDWTIPSHCYFFGSRNPEPFATAFEAHSAINMALDVLILLTALFILTKPDLTRKEIWGLVGLYNIGAFVGAISIWRLVTIVNHRAGTWPTYDMTFYAPISIILSCLEVEIAILLASMPIFWPLLIELGIGKILVVREVQVETEHRRLDNDSSSEYELASALEHNRERSISDPDSVVELNSKSSKRSFGEQQRYYKDQYTIERVDPLNPGQPWATEARAERAKVPVEHIERFTSRGEENNTKSEWK